MAEIKKDFWGENLLGLARKADEKGEGISEAEEHRLMSTIVTILEKRNGIIIAEQPGQHMGIFIANKNMMELAGLLTHVAFEMKIPLALLQQTYEFWVQNHP